MDKFEVSNGQFAAFLKATTHTPEGDVFGWNFVLDFILDEQTRYAGIRMCMCVVWYIYIYI
jgi:formylglycine-generating enzyme required for sulfatase activity